MLAIILISGAVNSGKTSLMLDIMQEEALSGSRVTGILALSVIENGQKTGFEVLDVATGEKRMLATLHPETIAGETLISIGRYHFLEKNFKFALDILFSVDKSGAVFVDEVGPLELSGGGYADAIRKIVSGVSGKVYISVRSSCLEKFVGMFLSGIPYTVRHTGEK